MHCMVLYVYEPILSPTKAVKEALRGYPLYR